MSGIDPRDLHTRTLDSFAWGGADRAVAQMRSDAYARLRTEKMDALRVARAALLRGALPASLSVPSTARVVLLSASGASTTSSGADAAAERMQQSVLGAETARLAKIQKRQQVRGGAGRCCV